jgi:hypothetical protein
VLIGRRAGLLTGLISGRPSADPFALRDPVYIERTLPAWELMSRAYFRADVRGRLYGQRAGSR